MRLLAEARCKGEGAAPARRAVHGDRPAHQGDQPGSDGQAQAGAAVLARGRGVLLLEGPEDAILLPGFLPETLGEADVVASPAAEPGLDTFVIQQRIGSDDRD